MAKDRIPLTCGVCGGAGGKNVQQAGMQDPKTGRIETTYRWVSCGPCGGKGIINR